MLIQEYRSGKPWHFCRCVFLRECKPPEKSSIRIHGNRNPRAFRGHDQPKYEKHDFAFWGIAAMRLRQLYGYGRNKKAAICLLPLYGNRCVNQ